MKFSIVTFVIGVVVLMMVSGIGTAQGAAQEAGVVKQDVSVKDASVAKAKTLPPIGGETSNYTFGKGDVVDIQVRNNPEFSGNFVIGPDGNIQYTFIGDLKAEGLTKSQLKDLLTKELERYIKIPEVDVTVAAYLSKFVYILGEVGRPGKYPMQGDTVLLRDLLVGAGLPTREAALRRVIVVKPDPHHPKFRKVDIYKLLYKGILKDNFVLQPDQVVVVPSTVPAEFNRALKVLLDPFKQGKEAGELMDYYGVN